MYLIKIYDGVEDTEGTIIHTPYANGEKLTSGNIKLVGDGVDSFEFSINPSNPALNKIRPLVTLIKITDVNNGKLLFDGRVLKPVQTMTANGQFNIKYTAESKLAYLHDSTQRHGEYNNMTVRDFLVEIIAQHNRQVEPHKRFEVGNVTVTTNMDNIYRFLGYEKTWDAIQDKLISRLGGHIRLREGKYIDYLESVGELRNTPIRLRTNLKDMQKEIDPTEIITRLVPLGARLETEEGGSGISEPRLTIESVNNGKDYIDDQALISEFGIIEGNMTWDEVNTPSTLLLRGNQFFRSQRAARVSYDVTAPNLNLIDMSFEEFQVDDIYPIDNPVLAIDEPIQVIGKDIDINNPQQSKLQIGDKRQTLSNYQAQANKNTLEVKTLENQILGLGAGSAQLKQQLIQTQLQLQTIQDSLDGTDYPSYWISHLSQKINRVRNLNTQSTNAHSFGFITDVHIDTNGGHSYALMRKVARELDLQTVIIGGDLVRNPPITPKTEVVRQIKEVIQGFNPLGNKTMMTMGNHDDNTLSGLWAETIRPSDQYDLMFKYMGNSVVYGPSGRYHYRDDTFNKTRHIVLDSIDMPYIKNGSFLKYRGLNAFVFRQQQINWLINKALNTPQDWSVIVTSHAPPYKEGILGWDTHTRNEEIVRGVLGAYKDGATYTGSSLEGVPSDMQVSVDVDFTNSGGEVVAWFCGHVHYDNIVQLPEGFPLITVLNDGGTRWLDSPQRVSGTLTEQAFDVVTINKDERKIYMTRFGAGIDRSVSY